MRNVMLRGISGNSFVSALKILIAEGSMRSSQVLLAVFITITIISHFSCTAECHFRSRYQSTVSGVSRAASLRRIERML